MMKTKEMFKRVMNGQELSGEERIELSTGLVCDKVHNLLLKEVLMAQVGVKKDVVITLTADECRDSDENIRKVLSVLGVNDIEVSSDFPGYNESYTGSTKIKFRI